MNIRPPNRTFPAERAKDVMDFAMERGMKVSEAFLESMLVAYLARTDVDPRDVVLVEEREEWRTVYYFCHKDEVPDHMPGRGWTVKGET